MLNQVDIPEPVDPVTSSLQSRFGGGEVTNVTRNSAYVNGALVTALSDNENKMCTDANNIQIMEPFVTVPEFLKPIDSFLRGFGDALFNSLSPFKEAPQEFMLTVNFFHMRVHMRKIYIISKKSYSN